MKLNTREGKEIEVEVVEAPISRWPQAAALWGRCDLIGVMAILTNLPVGEVLALTPASYATLSKAVEEANPHFFGSYLPQVMVPLAVEKSLARPASS